MFTIIGALLGGWILQLFGFDAVVQTGMLELFGKTISTTGYYFLFGAMGALKGVVSMLGRSIGSGQKMQTKVNNKVNEFTDNLTKKK